MVATEQPSANLVWVVILEAGDGLNFARYDNTPILCAEGDKLLATAKYAASIIESGFARAFTAKVAAQMGSEPPPVEKEITLTELVGKGLEPIVTELGYKTVEDVSAAAMSDELLAVPGIGVRVLANIREKLDIQVE